MNKQEYLKTINSLRLKNKNNWYFWSGEVEGLNIHIKGYNTWLQIYSVDNINYPCPMDISVKKFNEVLNEPFIN